MELYVIGDLQLSDGGTGDDFRADDERALVSCLFRLSRVPGAELVLNGDIIDFTQIQPRPRMWYDDLLGASEDDSLLKLEAGAAGTRAGMGCAGALCRLRRPIDLALRRPGCRSALATGAGTLARAHRPIGR